ncbi:MAG: hypothetical protein HeimC3_47960, partial [Candidatus Heimdallarchaeota archaeon LC_3]
MSFLFRFLKKLIPGGKNDNAKSLEEDKNSENNNVLEKNVVSKQKTDEPTKKAFEEKKVQPKDIDSSLKEEKKPKIESILKKDLTLIKKVSKLEVEKSSDVEDKPKKKPKKKVDKGKDPYGHEFVKKIFDW